MRITYVCADPGIPVFGRKGASVHVQELVRAYRGLGHTVTLVAARLGGEPPDDLADLAVTELGAPAAADPAAREAACRAMDDALEARLLAGPAPDLVHERYSLWGGAGMRAAARLGRPAILEVNAPLIEEQATHRVLTDRAAAEERLRTTLTAAGAATAVSEPVAAWVRAHDPGLPVVVLPNGVDALRVAPGDARDTDAYTVGFVGTLKPWHGLETLVAALGIARRQVPAVRLLVVGDGPMRAPLAELAAAADVPLELTGALDPADVPAQLRRMDVATAPYPGGDANAYFSPLKVLEYMAAGLPIVASDVGQLPELLRDGRCGRLVPPDDPGALAAAIVGLAADPAARAALGAAARAKAVAEHGWDRVAERTLAAALAGRVPAR